MTERMTKREQRKAVQMLQRANVIWAMPKIVCPETITKVSVSKMDKPFIVLGFKK